VNCYPEGTLEERRVITDPAVIGMLLDHQRTTYLLPFMLAPHTVAEAALHRELKANQMAYWVNRFLKANLIEAVGEAPAAGKGRSKGQQYRATAAEFVMLPGGGYAADEIVQRTYGPMWASLQHAISYDTDLIASRWAIRIMVIHGRLITQQETPAELIGQDVLVPEGNALNIWMTARFDHATQQELRAELEDVLRRYAARIVRDRPELPRYYVHLALAEKKD
jgi:hypothetical protein